LQTLNRNFRRLNGCLVRKGKRARKATREEKAKKGTREIRERREVKGIREIPGKRVKGEKKEIVGRRVTKVTRERKERREKEEQRGIRETQDKRETRERKEIPGGREIRAILERKAKRELRELPRSQASENNNSSKISCDEMVFCFCPVLILRESQEVKTLAKQGNPAVQTVEGDTGMCVDRFNEYVAQGREARRSPGPSIVDIERRPGVTSPATFARIVPHPPSR
jgi:hypothetical protein